MSDIAFPWAEPPATPPMPAIAAPRCLAAALDYQARGFSVVAIHPVDPETGRCTCPKPQCDKAGKHVIGTWKEAQTGRRTAEAVKALFEKHPDAGVGIILDAGGVAVLDVDGPDGKASFNQLVKEGALRVADIKAAPQSKSGRTDGGNHLWFQLPKDGPRARATGFRPKLDLLSKGLVVMPPSRHASGKEYEWVRALNEAPLPPLPAGLEAILRDAEKPITESKDQSPAPGATIDARKYVEEFIDYLSDPKCAVEGVGGRDTMLAEHIVPKGKALGLSKRLMTEIVADHWWGHEGRCPVTVDFDLDREVARKYDNLTGTRPGEKQSGAKLVADGFMEAEDAPVLPVWDEPDESPVESETAKTPLDINTWLELDIPEVDYLMGSWLHTSSRALIVGDTGVGKTNVGLALACHMAMGKSFLNWPARRPAKVLYIDGEMGARLMKQRARDACRRLGAAIPKGRMFLLSASTVEGFSPLDTPEGRKYVDDLIAHLGGVDFIIFDNIMALVSGEMKDEAPWREVQPWILSLTKRNIGQGWFHHTGHDSTRSYGTKVREWQMDSVIHLTKQDRPGVDVCFDLSFRKARERTPENRSEFADIQVALVEDAWTWRPANPEDEQDEKTRAVLIPLLEVLRAHEGEEPLSVQRAAEQIWSRIGQEKPAVNTWRDRINKAMGRGGYQEIAGYAIRLQETKRQGSNTRTALHIDVLQESELSPEGPFNE